MASVLHLGMMRAAPFPCLGQIAPKIKAEAVRWSVGALGRVPRLAQRRVILFFWPMRASSANQTSMAAGSPPFSRPISSRRAGKLFKILDRALSLLVVTGTSRELTISHGAQFPAQCLLGDDDAEFLEDPLAEVDDPPAHDAMHGRDRAAFEYRGERGAVRAVQTRRLSGRLAINQPSRPMGVELQHPIANDLEPPPADLRRLGPARAVVNRRQRQKPPGLRPILRPPRGSPHHPRIKISPKWEWDWRTSCARHLESDTRRFGN